MVDLEQVFNRIEEVQHNILDTNPFWVAAKEGRLTRGHLKGILLEQYAFAMVMIKNFGAIMMKAPDTPSKVGLARFLIEEIQHPNLDIKMGKKLGLTEDDFVNHNPIPETKAWFSWRVYLQVHGTWAQNRAATALNEGFGQKHSKVMVEALDKHYGFSKEEMGVFPPHVEEDEGHSKMARLSIKKYAESEADLQAVMMTVEDSAYFIDLLYTGIYNRNQRI